MSIRKNEPFTTLINMTGTGHIKVGAIEYQMPASFADILLKERKGQDKNMNPQEFLVRYVNDECGLLYNCVKVTTF